MPGPKMGPRPPDFDEEVIRQSPTFVKWSKLAVGEKLRYACREFIKGHDTDEERLMRRIMIARRNNLRDHETLKRARRQQEKTTPPKKDGEVASPTVAQPTHEEVVIPPTVVPTPVEISDTTGPTANNPRKRRPPSTFSDAQVLKEMDAPAVEATRSYRAWMALSEGTEFVYNQRYIKGKEGHDWLLRKNIWRRMRYRRENKKMVEKMKEIKPMASDFVNTKMAAAAAAAAAAANAAAMDGADTAGVTTGALSPNSSEESAAKRARMEEQLPSSVQVQATDAPGTILDSTSLVVTSPTTTTTAPASAAGTAAAVAATTMLQETDQVIAAAAATTMVVPILATTEPTHVSHMDEALTSSQPPPTSSAESQTDTATATAAATASASDEVVDSAAVEAAVAAAESYAKLGIAGVHNPLEVEATTVAALDAAAKLAAAAAANQEDHAEGTSDIKTSLVPDVVAMDVVAAADAVAMDVAAAAAASVDVSIPMSLKQDGETKDSEELLVKLETGAVKVDMDDLEKDTVVTEV